MDWFVKGKWTFSNSRSRFTPPCDFHRGRPEFPQAAASVQIPRETRILETSGRPFLFQIGPHRRASTKVEILPDSPFHFLTDLSSNDSRNKPARGSPLPDRSRNFALSFRSRRPPFVFSLFLSLSLAVRSWETRVFFLRSDPITRNPISVYPSIRVRNPNGNRRLNWIRKILQDKRGRLISISFALDVLYGCSKNLSVSTEGCNNLQFIL